VAARLRSLLVVALVLGLAGVAAAQFGGFRRYPPRPPAADTFGLGFNFCRGIYTSVRSEAGGSGWTTDYPDADLNFSIRLSELTRTRVKFLPDGMPDFVTVPLDDPAIFQCPFVLMSDVGTIGLSLPEIETLRAYLQKGGFLWVDDFWGTIAWEWWTSEIARVLPPSEFVLHEVPPDHPVLRMQFQVTSIPQIPSIQHWRRNPFSTSERGADSETARLWAISDDTGRIMVLMSHNTDISDAWEREGEDPAFFYQFSPDGYALGINVLLYAMTH
jgi:hypothetical protein